MYDRRSASEIQKGLQYLLQQEEACNSFTKMSGKKIPVILYFNIFK